MKERLNRMTISLIAFFALLVLPVGYRRCRPRAVLCRGPYSHLKIFARGVDRAGLIALVADTIDAVSSKLYVSHLTYNLHASGPLQYYTLDVEVVGDRELLQQLEDVVNQGGLFDHHDPVFKAKLTSAQPTLLVPRHLQKKLSIRYTMFDETGIVKSIASTVLEFGGTFHRFVGETINSGRYPSNPDFDVDSLAGFPTVHAAEQAVKALEQLRRSDLDVVAIDRLYKHPQGGSGS